MTPGTWLYNGHPVAKRDPRLPQPTATERRRIVEDIELDRRANNLTDPTDSIALARRLWDQIATRHMEALDAQA